MPDYLQQKRKIRVTTPLGEDVLLLKSFSGSEAISTLFGYRLEMIATNETKVPFDAILGQKLTIHMQLPDESETHLNGLCVRFVQAERDQVFTTYEAEIVPDVWKLSRKAQSRIFQRKSVPEILAKVFEGFDVDWQIGGRFEPRDYCVQYRETDWNFGARLMEEEGIRFYFRHSDGSHTMVVSNNATDHPELPGENSFVYEELEGGTRDDNRIWAWRKEQEMRPGKYVLWDHCFEMPHRHLEAEALIHDSLPVGKESHKLKVAGVDQLEIYDFPGEYAQRVDGINAGGGEQPAELQKIFRDNQRTAEIRMDEETTPAVVIRAKSNVKHMVPGFRFKLQKHFSGDGPYVVTGVRHQASFGADYRSGQEPLMTYENDLTCIPRSLPYRPRRATPKPVVQGSQTAVVVGPSGEEIFTDKYGRVKVQFHWDREGRNDQDSSCWIRVGTSWAGRQWGAIRIPRVGQEVIVDFLEGDPDQPIIVGSVYNADMMPPYTLPANKTQSGVKSRSSLSGTPANCNELRFEDKKGSEQVLLHAEKNLDTEVEADETRWVGHDRTTTIDHDDTLHVKHDESVTVDNNRTTIIGADDTELVKGTQSLTVTKDRTTVVIGEEAETFARSRATTITTDDTLSVGSTLTIIAPTLTIATATTTLTASGTVTLTAAASMSVNVGGTANVSVGGTAAISVAGAATIQAGGAVSVSAGGAVAVNASAIALNAGVVTCAGILMATTVVTSSVVSAAYTPGAGNIW